jgi:polyhydroxyalkanoate synthase
MSAASRSNKATVQPAAEPAVPVAKPVAKATKGRNAAANVAKTGAPKAATATIAKEKPAAAKPATANAAAPKPASEKTQAAKSVAPAKAPAAKAPAAKTPAAKPPAASAKAVTGKAAAKTAASLSSQPAKPPRSKAAAAAPASTPSKAKAPAKSTAASGATTAKVRTKPAAAASAAPVKHKAAPAPSPARPKLVAIDGGASQNTPKAAETPPTILAKPITPSPAAAAAPPGETPADDPFRFQAMDVERLSANVARFVELGGKALANYLKPRESGGKSGDPPDAVADVVKTLGHVAEYWLKDPARTLHAQTQVAGRYFDLWSQSLKAMSGEPADPVVKPDPRDARFKDRQWNDNPFFDFLKQFYLVTADLAETFVTQAELDEHLKHKASFYMKQIANALSPSNFVPTNPELLRETIGSSGENLVRGMQMLAEDIERGGGDLKIRQSDDTTFALGRNLAMTPGKVVFENDLIQLIQYTPTTEKVGQIPLVIVPPWINKFYILDLVADKSFIKWAVDQGLTVFVISWVNPDERHAHKSFDDYMLEGPLSAFRVASEITGQKKLHTIGYCVGGTLLAVTLAYMAAKGIDQVETATFFTTQVDFTYAGDLKVFVDEEQIRSLEKRMAQHGYLEGKEMATAFNMLRSNDLIWSYVVNNYMKGKAPMPFDLLYWNADSPRMPAANHSFYLRHCYLQNDLSNGRMEVAGEKLDLKKVKVPVYNLATREDHIAPARSVFLGSSAFGGPVDYVMAGSGHIAGVVNPPAKHKYQHWTGGPPTGSFENWFASAIEHPGSWWPHWREWIRARDGKEVAARPVGSPAYPPIEDAPGRYVKVKV